MHAFQCAEHRTIYRALQIKYRWESYDDLAALLSIPSLLLSLSHLSSPISALPGSFVTLRGLWTSAMTPGRVCRGVVHVLPPTSKDGAGPRTMASDTWLGV